MKQCVRIGLLRFVTPGGSWSVDTCSRQHAQGTAQLDRRASGGGLDKAHGNMRPVGPRRSSRWTVEKPVGRRGKAQRRRGRPPHNEVRRISRSCQHNLRSTCRLLAAVLLLTKVSCPVHARGGSARCLSGARRQYGILTGPIRRLCTHGPGTCPSPLTRTRGPTRRPSPE